MHRGLLIEKQKPPAILSPSPRMRILHIVGTISPAAGGPTEVIRTLVRHAPADIQSEIATLDDPASPFLADFPCPTHALGSSKKSWYVPAFARWLAANRARFDGVLLHGLWEYTGLATLRTLAGHTPYAVFPHGMLDPYFKRAHPAKHLKKSLYWRAIESRVLRRAHRVLFTTAVERDLAQQTFSPARWQSLVVPIGAEPPPPNPAQLLSINAGRRYEAKNFYSSSAGSIRRKVAISCYRPSRGSRNKILSFA
jgi:glycosyltransferase involved in cell wall biosynthesis